MVLTDSYGDGWSSNSTVIISSESGVLGEFTFSSGLSVDILIHPIFGQIIGMTDRRVIMDCDELENLPSDISSLIVGSNVCNSDSISKVNLTNTGCLQSIEIGKQFHICK